MDTPGPPGGAIWLLLLGLLLASGLVSGSETAVFSLRPSERRRLAASHAGLGAVLARPTNLLITLLLANLTVNVAYFSLSASLSLRYQAAGRPWVSTAVALGGLAAMVVGGEILPKTLALIDPPRFVAWLAPGLLVLRVALVPAVVVGSTLTRLFESLVLGTPERSEPPAAADFKQALSSGAALGTYHAVELALLHDVVDVASRRARDLMVPRVDVAFLDLDEPRERWIEVMAQRVHGEFPVVRGSPDALVGTVSAMEVLTRPDVPREDLVEPALLAPLAIAADALVLRLQDEGRRLAILLDEFGGVAGVVGLGELCQAVLGEIEPLAAGTLVEARGGALLVRGRCPVRVLREDYGLRLDTRRADTVAGALAEALGRVPRRGDELELPGWRLRVVDLRGSRVERILARPARPASAPGLLAEGEAPA